MGLPLYLAMTAGEMEGNSSLPEHPGYMACHFSPYSTGLSNRPAMLPQGAMLILNDRTPMAGHDPALIGSQLADIVTEFGCDCVLLDFQRPGSEEVRALASIIPDALPCPVGVSELYAAELSCPVFLPPVPADTSVREYLLPWAGREIWLEAAMDGKVITLTPKGSQFMALAKGERPEDGFRDEELHCHYHITLGQEDARFFLYRTREDLQNLLAAAESLGVTRAVGLWQELKDPNT